MLQIRPGPGRDPRMRDPMYAPHRDIAYIGPQILFLAIAEVLEPRTWDPAFKAMLEDRNVSLETLNEAAMRLANAFADVSALRCSFDEALKRSGFTAMPPFVQAVFFMKMGRYLLAGMHRGLGDIVDYDGPSPPHITKMVEDIHAAARKISNVTRI